MSSRLLKTSSGGYAQIRVEIISSHTGESERSFFTATDAKGPNPRKKQESAPGRFAPGDATIGPKIGGAEEKNKDNR